MLEQEEAAQANSEEQADVRKPHFIKQIVRNACGTMALLHAVINVAETCGGQYPEGSFLHRLMGLAAAGKTPEELGAFLNEDPELETVHGAFASQGQSQMDSNTAYHFVAYVNLEGVIWEVDGRRNKPLQKGSCTQEDFGLKISALLQGYIQMDDTCRFSLMALSPNQGE